MLFGKKKKKKQFQHNNAFNFQSFLIFLQTNVLADQNPFVYLKHESLNLLRHIEIVYAPLLFGLWSSLHDWALISQDEILLTRIQSKPILQLTEEPIYKIPRVLRLKKKKESFSRVSI